MIRLPFYRTPRRLRVVMIYQAACHARCANMQRITHSGLRSIDAINLFHESSHRFGLVFTHPGLPSALPVPVSARPPVSSRVGPLPRPSLGTLLNIGIGHRPRASVAAGLTPPAAALTARELATLHGGPRGECGEDSRFFGVGEVR